MAALLINWPYSTNKVILITGKITQQLTDRNIFTTASNTAQSMQTNNGPSASEVPQLIQIIKTSHIQYVR